MKFINYLESVTGIGVYPLTSLLIFFFFFVGVAIFVIKGRKEYFEMLSGIPLTKDRESSTSKTLHHENNI